jgi:hypothetical protein
LPTVKITGDVIRGNEQTNYRHTTGAISFSVRLVTTSGTTFGADTQYNSFMSAPVGGMVGVTNRLTFNEATQAGCWQGACRFSNAP